MAWSMARTTSEAEVRSAPAAQTRMAMLKVRTSRALCGSSSSNASAAHGARRFAAASKKARRLRRAFASSPVGRRLRS